MTATSRCQTSRLHRSSTELSRDAFHREFGLTAKALREGGEDLLSAGGRLAETLAASSAGMSELSRIKEGCKARPKHCSRQRRSSNKPFYLAADRREAADKAVRDAIVTARRCSSWNTAVQEAREQLEVAECCACGERRHPGALAADLRVRSQLTRLESLARSGRSG